MPGYLIAPIACGTACCLVLLPLSQFLAINMSMNWLGSVSGQILQFFVPKVGNSVHCSTFSFFKCLLVIAVFLYWLISPYHLWIWYLSWRAERSSFIAQPYNIIEACSGLVQGCYSVSMGIWLHDHVISSYSCQCCPLVFVLMATSVCPIALGVVHWRCALSYTIVFQKHVIHLENKSDPLSDNISSGVLYVQNQFCRVPHVALAFLKDIRAISTHPVYQSAYTI